MEFGLFLPSSLIPQTRFNFLRNFNVSNFLQHKRTNDLTKKYTPYSQRNLNGQRNKQVENHQLKIRLVKYLLNDCQHIIINSGGSATEL